MGNSQFEAALELNNTGVPPIWFMRQAGRYHQHYQKLRSKSSFLELCRQPELASQVALGPIEDFDFDAAILFSDILFPLEALGRSLDFTEAGPKLGSWLPLQDLTQCESLPEASARLRFQGEAVTTTRRLLPAHKSLIGFIGGPWTLFTYWMEETHKGPLLESKRHLSFYPQFMEVLEPLLKAAIKMQLDAGAEVVNIFDTSAGELSPNLFAQLVTPVLSRLATAFPKQIMYYSRGTQPAHFQEAFWRQESALLGVGVDHRWALPEAFALFPEKVIQGNFDQTLLFLPTSEFQLHFKNFVAAMRSAPKEHQRRWICGLGHGILPKTPENHVRWMVQYLREAWS
jgi:uroporphyrinogen decarboxylase